MSSKHSVTDCDVVERAIRGVALLWIPAEWEAYELTADSQIQSEKPGSRGIPPLTPSQCIRVYELRYLDKTSPTPLPSDYCRYKLIRVRRETVG